jgi:hypothetical protein
MRTRLLLALVAALLLALLAPVAASAFTYDTAVDKLLTAGYPQSIEEFLTSQGTSDIGMAFGGSSADTARAEYLAKQLKALGYKVRLEAVPLDVMEFKGASVTAGGETYVASTFGGVRGTPVGGITGRLVYLGAGTAPETAAAGDLTGKIAIIDAYLGSWWMNWPWTEAALAGASAGRYATGQRPAADNVRLQPATNVAYCVPHTVSTHHEQTVYLRVRRPLEQSTLRLSTTDGRVVHERKLRYVVPAEMVSLTLRPAVLADFHGDALQVEVVAR